MWPELIRHLFLFTQVPHVVAINFYSAPAVCEDQVVLAAKRVEEVIADHWHPRIVERCYVRTVTLSGRIGRFYAISFNLKSNLLA